MQDSILTPAEVVEGTSPGAILGRAVATVSHRVNEFLLSMDGRGCVEMSVKGWPAEVLRIVRERVIAAGWNVEHVVSTQTWVMKAGGAKIPVGTELLDLVEKEALDALRALVNENCVVEAPVRERAAEAILGHVQISRQLTKK